MGKGREGKGTGSRELGWGGKAAEAEARAEAAWHQSPPEQATGSTMPPWDMVGSSKDIQWAANGLQRPRNNSSLGIEPGI